MERGVRKRSGAQANPQVQVRADNNLIRGEPRGGVTESRLLWCPVEPSACYPDEFAKLVSFRRRKKSFVQRGAPSHWYSLAGGRGASQPIKSAESRALKSPLKPAAPGCPSMGLRFSRLKWHFHQCDRPCWSNMPSHRKLAAEHLGGPVLCALYDYPN